MRFVVPQNITLEDKVIGPLTLKQFFYLLGGALVGFVIYTAASPAFGQIGGLVATLPTDVLALALAFLKINDQPFVVFLQAVVTFFFSPKRRLWLRVAERVDIRVREEKPAAPVKKAEKQAVKRDKLGELAQILDSQGWEKGQLGDRVVSAAEQKQQLKLS